MFRQTFNKVPHVTLIPTLLRPININVHIHKSAEVKERVQLYLYSPSGPSWPVIG
jgi:hypothetical protein